MFRITETHSAATWLLDPRAPKVEMPKIVSERIRLSLENAKKIVDENYDVTDSEDNEFNNPDLYKRTTKSEDVAEYHWIR